ncbi:MAG TPA: HAD family hydrolase [Candidatus Hydrogenedentes bacterium]|nr:HAD family hydrolase [Candidatus Hydrogenedentota bacterium]
MAIRAITFDFWGTLFRDTGAELRQAMRLKAFCEATGAAPETAMNALETTFAEFQRSHIEDQRTLSPLDAVHIACSVLNIKLKGPTVRRLAHIFATAIIKYPPEPIEGALDAVRTAAQRWPVGLISDTGVSPGSSLRQILGREGFAGYMSAFTFSNEVGVAKPQAPMFERTARILGVAPNELFHLGDLQPTDILGVQNVGGKAGLFAGFNTRFIGHTTAEYTFTSWQEFITILPQIC